MPDGTLELDSKPKLPPGRVIVVLQQNTAPSAPAENWLQSLLRIRARREAEGYEFMDEKETEAHLEWLREEDRIDDLLRDSNKPGPHPGQP